MIQSYQTIVLIIPMLQRAHYIQAVFINVIAKHFVQQIYPQQLILLQ